MNSAAYRCGGSYEGLRQPIALSDHGCLPKFRKFSSADFSYQKRLRRLPHKTNRNLKLDKFIIQHISM